jgi:hypothetical protein
MDFISYALKRKGSYEFGDKELIFYDTGSYVAQLADLLKPGHPNFAKYKTNCYELLSYIQSTDSHMKYLRAINHIGKKKKPADLQ